MNPFATIDLSQLMNSKVTFPHLLVKPFLLDTQTVGKEQGLIPIDTLDNIITLTERQFHTDFEL